MADTKPGVPRPPQHSEAYLGVNFGVVKNPELTREVGKAVSTHLEAAKRVWAEVDKRRPAILANAMETPARNLAQLDEYAQAQRKRVDVLMNEAGEAIVDELARIERQVDEALTPADKEVVRVENLATHLARQTPERRHEIIQGAIEDGHYPTIKAALGSPAWLTGMTKGEHEIARARFKDRMVPGTLAYQDNLHKLYGQVENATKQFAKHFNELLSADEKRTLANAKGSAQAAQAALTDG